MAELRRSWIRLTRGDVTRGVAAAIGVVLVAALVGLALHRSPGPTFEVSVPSASSATCVPLEARFVATNTWVTRGVLSLPVEGRRDAGRCTYDVPVRLDSLRAEELDEVRVTVARATRTVRFDARAGREADAAGRVVVGGAAELVATERLRVLELAP